MFQPTLISIIEGAIPVLGGIYATLIGFGVVSGTKDPESQKMKQLRPMLKILGPLVIVFGIWLMGQGSPPAPYSAACTKPKQLPVLLSNRPLSHPVPDVESSCAFARR